MSSFRVTANTFMLYCFCLCYLRPFSNTFLFLYTCLRELFLFVFLVRLHHYNCCSASAITASACSSTLARSSSSFNFKAINITKLYILYSLFSRGLYINNPFVKLKTGPPAYLHFLRRLTKPALLKYTFSF